MLDIFGFYNKDVPGEDEDGVVRDEQFQASLIPEVSHEQHSREGLVNYGQSIFPYDGQKEGSRYAFNDSIGQCTWTAYFITGDRTGIFPVERGLDYFSPYGDAKNFDIQVNREGEYGSSIPIDRFDGQYQRNDILVFGSKTGHGHVVVVDNVVEFNGKEYLQVSQGNLYGDATFSQNYYDPSNQEYYDLIDGKMVPIEHQRIGPLEAVNRFDSIKYDRDINSRASEIVLSHKQSYDENLNALNKYVTGANGFVIQPEISQTVSEVEDMLRQEGRLTKNIPSKLNGYCDMSYELVLGTPDINQLGQEMPKLSFDSRYEEFNDYVVSLLGGKSYHSEDSYVNEGEGYKYYLDNQWNRIEIQIYSPEKFMEKEKLLDKTGQYLSQAAIDAEKWARTQFSYCDRIQKLNPEVVKGEEAFKNSMDTIYNKASDFEKDFIEAHGDLQVGNVHELIDNLFDRDK